MTHISSLASSFSPCRVVTPNRKSFHRAVPHKPLRPLMLKCHARRNARERKPVIFNSHIFPTQNSEVRIRHDCFNAGRPARLRIARATSGTTRTRQPACDAKLQAPGRRLHRARLPLQVRRDACGIAPALPHPGHCRPRRPWARQQRRPDPPRYRRLGWKFSRAAICRRPLRPGPASGHHPLLHHPARQHRPRKIQQTERRPARAFPAIRIRRHGRRAARTSGKRPPRQPSPPGHGHVHGLHALLDLGRSLSRFPGRAHAPCLPVQIAGRNRLWRKMLMSGIRQDPGWQNGDYTTEPRAGLEIAADMLLLAGSAPLPMQRSLPTRDAADRYLQDVMKREMETLDANDLLYAVNASRNYDPSADLGQVSVPVMFVNSADDFINPPELGIAEREIQKVKNGKFVLLPASEQTHGHGTHTWAALWQQYLKELLDESQTPPAAVK